MPEISRERYAVNGQSLKEITNGLNFILSRISDRLDQIEGLRGTPAFYKNVFDFLSADASLTAGQVLKASSTTRAEMAALAVTDVSGAAPDISSGQSAQVDLEMSLISLVDWENNTVVHQFPTQWLEYNTEVSMFYTQEGPTVLNIYGDVTGPVSATDNNLAQFNGATGKVIEDSGLSNTDVASAVSLKHTQGTDTALGAVGTKDPPIDADKVIYRDSTASDALVTSTWAQVKAFLKTYFDTLYVAVTGRYRYAASMADDGTVALPTITANYTAHGFIHVSSSGVINESAELEIDSTGTAQIIRGSANVVVNADTDTKVCIGTAAAQNPMTVKNRLGGARNIMITLWYN